MVRCCFRAVDRALLAASAGAVSLFSAVRLRYVSLGYIICGLGARPCPFRLKISFDCERTYAFPPIADRLLDKTRSAVAMWSFWRLWACCCCLPRRPTVRSATHARLCFLSYESLSHAPWRVPAGYARLAVYSAGGIVGGVECPCHALRVFSPRCRPTMSGRARVCRRDVLWRRNGV